jgi:ribosomal protein S6--L-glutamate ligase
MRASAPPTPQKHKHEATHPSLRLEHLLMVQMPKPLILGWQEWIALPDLGLPALKAKIDTGAKTSALHTHSIEPYGSGKRPMVRFSVRPSPQSASIEIEASAPVIDRREVRSSNGERELRYVIVTRLKLGDRQWPIEVTLTNRERMTYRMLLGRQAIQPDMLVDPAATFRQPRLSYALYPER